jgi:hypothetical protein
MSRHWPIVATIIAAVNAWAIFGARLYLDKRTTKTKLKANKSQESISVRTFKRWLMFFTVFGSVLSVSGVVYVLRAAGVTRGSVFFVFVFTVALSAMVANSMFGYFLIKGVGGLGLGRSSKK